MRGFWAIDPLSSFDLTPRRRAALTGMAVAETVAARRSAWIIQCSSQAYVWISEAFFLDHAFDRRRDQTSRRRRATRFGSPRILGQPSHYEFRVVAERQLRRIEMKVGGLHA